MGIKANHSNKQPVNILTQIHTKYTAQYNVYVIYTYILLVSFISKTYMKFIE